MTVVPIRTTRYEGVSLTLLPVERRYLLDMTRNSCSDAARRLFWMLVPFDNGAPGADTVFFEESDVNILIALAESEGADPRILTVLTRLKCATEVS